MQDSADIPTVALGTVKTIDGEEIERNEARNLSRRMYLTGFFLLPWIWVMNIWLFWPVFMQGTDTVIQSYTRKSAIGAVAMTALFLPWMLTYSIGQNGVFGSSFYRKIDSSRLDLD